MTGEALILAAHGSTREPATAELVRHHVQRLRALQLFQEVTEAYHQGHPGFAEALNLLQSHRVTVVPLMTSQGYYSEVVLPRALTASPRHAEVEVCLTPPVGTHPLMVTLVAERINTLLQRYDLAPEDTTVLLVGHGTRRHSGSRESTDSLAARLRERRQIAEVAVAFLDDDPGIAEACTHLQATNMVVIPFLIGMGPHARRDIPEQLGLPAQEQATWPRVARRGERRVICDQTVGSYDGIEHIVVALAREARQQAPPTPTIRLGARGSRLSLWQANHVADRLRAQGLNINIVEISTTGDRRTDTPIAVLPGRAPFADDIEAALHAGDIDLAVHSLKDLAADPDPRLCLAAILQRHEPGEALVARDGMRLAELPAGATVGTSSRRRRLQLQGVRPDLVTVPLRGTVEQRVRQVRAGQLDAAILAVAGLQRLDLLQEISERLPMSRFLPAPAQGALAVQMRSTDRTLIARCAALDHEATRRAVTAELIFLRAFEHDADWVAAAYAEGEERIRLQCRLLGLSGVCAITVEHTDPQVAGREAVDQAMRYIAEAVEPA